MNKLQVYNLFKKRPKMNKGMFISVEGVDGSGKQTQVNKLAEHLIQEGFKVKVIGFPQYENPIGKVISSFLRGEYGSIDEVSSELICIAYAADRVSLRDEIETYLKAGYIVLSDRYTYSNLFSAAKLPEEERINFIKWVERIEFEEMNVVTPHHNFFLYVDPSISAQRIAERGKREYQDGKDDIFESNLNHLSEVAKTYRTWAEKTKDRESNGWTIIDQMKDDKQMSIEEVFEIFKKEIHTILDNFSK